MARSLGKIIKETKKKRKLQNGQQSMSNCKQHTATGEVSTDDKYYLKVIAEALLKLERATKIQ